MLNQEPYVSLLIVSAATAMALAILSWGRPATSGSRWFSLLMVGVTEWSIVRSLEAAATTLTAKVAWAAVEYVGVTSVPVLWLLFTLAYSEHPCRRTPRRLALLWLIPAITVSLALTNNRFHLLWPRITWSQDGTHTLIYSHASAWFWVSSVYEYLLMAGGFLVLIWGTRRFPRFYRGQAFMILITAMVPWIGNLLYLSGHSPFPHQDMTPVGFSVAAPFWFVALFRFRVFDLVPVAHSRLIEYLAEGVLVIDAQGRVIDHNPAARTLIGPLLRGHARDIQTLHATWPALVALCEVRAPAHAEICATAVLPHWLDVRIIALPHWGEHGGLLVVLRDITAQKQYQERLRELAHYDLLTGLANRALFLQHLGEILATNIDTLALLFVDLDGFKAINDDYGHQAGDQVLQAIGERLRIYSPASTLIARLAGDEFTVLLAGATQVSQAETIARRIIDACLQPIALPDRRIVVRVGASVGISRYPTDGQDVRSLLKAADSAMYVAKRAGKHRYAVYVPELAASIGA